MTNGEVTPVWHAGGGVELGVRVLRYLDLTASTSVHPSIPFGATPPASSPILTFGFGLRTGFEGKHYALNVGLAPGFVSSIPPLGYATITNSSADPSRSITFQWVGTVGADVKLSGHVAVRTTLQNTVIRYKSNVRDPDGIGSPPRLSFLSHENYVNSTNWGIKTGPVIRF